ncbi:2459_t:CDS:1, partial [Dentiscutata heterogama]
MLEQLIQCAILIFEALHPNCVGNFCFDQSTNHNAMAGNILVATKMNLGLGKSQPKLHDG